MSGFPPDSPPSDHHGDAVSTAEGQEVRDVERLFLSHEEEMQSVDGSWNQDGGLQGHLETRWVLWHEFMEEHAHLDTWLRLAEKAVSSSSPAPIVYITAKEELRRFERLQVEAGSRLVQLDDLTRRNRTLTRQFQGAMQSRLLAAAREAGRRWDDVNAKLECVIGRLKFFVSEWEEFEAEREELSLWLSDLDVRLTEVDHLTGNTCEKLRQLQSFQQCVCVNSGRVNFLLRRGEALMQRCEASDVLQLETRLTELLRRCNLVYSDISRTHSRLLSMRLVFEEDLILPQAPDSGCPSETLLEEEGAFDKSHLELPAFPTHPSARSSSPVHLPPAPPSPSSPTHEHLGLEWDPSVDIGRSVSHDDADSSYFSGSTGVCHRDSMKRRSYLSSLGSHSDISNDITNQEAALRLEGWLDHTHPGVLSPIASRGGGALPNRDQWMTLTPDGHNTEVFGFDGGRVRAWLGVQSPAPLEGTSCSRAVQTDGQVECYLEGRHSNTPFPAPALSPSHDLKASSEWMTCRCPSSLQAEEEEAEHLVPEQSTRPPSSLPSPALMCLFLATALSLLACLLWFFLDPSCRPWAPHGFHLALRYVNGPPPT